MTATTARPVRWPRERDFFPDGDPACPPGAIRTSPSPFFETRASARCSTALFLLSSVMASPPTLRATTRENEVQRGTEQNDDAEGDARDGDRVERGGHVLSLGDGNCSALLRSAGRTCALRRNGGGLAVSGNGRRRILLHVGKRRARGHDAVGGAPRPRSALRETRCSRERSASAHRGRRGA